MQNNNCQLYLISPESFDIKEFKDNVLQAFEGGQIGAFQLRMKKSSDDDIKRAAEIIMPICKNNGTQFILNDRPDLAAALGADGVHIGEEQDGTYESARKIIGKDKVVGISCYGSIDRAIDFSEKGADYVAFGAFYPTTTKTPKARPSKEILEWWSRNSVIPCVAIGGINAENCSPLVASGADFIAVVSAIWTHAKGPKKAVKELLDAIASV